jgi:WD40 repeat protein
MRKLAATSAAALHLASSQVGLCGGKTRAVDVHGDPLPAGASARLGSSRLQHGGSIDVLSFVPDGKGLLLIGTSDRFRFDADNTVRLWDPNTGKEVRSFPIQQGSIASTAFLPAAEGKDVSILRGNCSPGAAQKAQSLTSYTAVRCIVRKGADLANFTVDGTNTGNSRSGCSKWCDMKSNSIIEIGAALSRKRRNCSNTFSGGSSSRRQTTHNGDGIYGRASCRAQLVSPPTNWRLSTWENCRKRSWKK